MVTVSGGQIWKHLFGLLVKYKIAKQIHIAKIAFQVHEKWVMFVFYVIRS